VIHVTEEFDFKKLCMLQLLFAPQKNRSLLFYVSTDLTIKFPIMSIQNIAPDLLMSMPGGTELIIILLVVVILFGGKKIPELAKGLGKGMRDFKQAKDGISTDIENGMKEPQTKTAE
jgi:sec-independent protein translocase protein TatA